MITSGVHEEEEPDALLRETRFVLRVDREDVETGVPGEDEERIQRDDRDERAVAKDVAVRARAARVAAGRPVRLGHEREHHEPVDEERGGVEEEERGEGPGESSPR